MTIATDLSGTDPVAPTMLAAPEDVRGVNVHGRDGDKLGTIDKLIFDKRSGRVAFVILSSGGFLGLGQSYHPLPWSAFRFEAAENCYSVAIDKRILDEAPSFRPDNAPTFDEAYGRRVTDYYSMPDTPPTNLAGL